MIALLKNKKSEEDTLTGEFFGCLRYISFQKVMKEILLDCVNPKEIREQIEQINDTVWADKVKFWDRQKSRGRTVELDVRVDLESYILGIEVKYMSGLSSEDEAEDEVTSETSMNQLSKEARILKQIAQTEGKQAILLLLGCERHIKAIYEESKMKVDSDVLLGYFSWEDVRRNLAQIKLANSYDRDIINDLILLLNHYKFNRFESFELDEKQYKKVNKNNIWQYEVK